MRVGLTAVLSTRPIAFCVLLLIVVGCGETEQISRYGVPKEVKTPVAPGAPSNLDDVHSFATQPASAWFLKVTGPAEAVAAIEGDFQALVESSSISSGSPEWMLPEGWKQAAGSGMRFATLTIDKTDPPLEVSVIKLPYQGDRETYLQENISRWRGQIGLPPSTGADWRTTAEAAGEVRPLESVGQDVTLVDLSGKTEEIPQARMLAAILLPMQPATAATRPAEPMTPPVASPGAPAAGTEGPLAYEVPEGWQPGRTSVMRVAAFGVADGDRKVEITAIAAGGNVLDNVNRWRGQVMLGPWTDDDLQENAEELTVDGQPATYVNLEGPEQTILAAILPGEPQSWFFKLTGDPELAKREAERFKAFVESVTLK